MRPQSACNFVKDKKSAGGKFRKRRALSYQRSIHPDIYSSIKSACWPCLTESGKKYAWKKNRKHFLREGTNVFFYKYYVKQINIISWKNLNYEVTSAIHIWNLNDWRPSLMNTKGDHDTWRTPKWIKLAPGNMKTNFWFLLSACIVWIYFDVATRGNILIGTCYSPQKNKSRLLSSRNIYAGKFIFHISLLSLYPTPMPIYCNTSTHTGENEKFILRWL